MPCESCRFHGCREMGEFSRRWLLDGFVRGERVECAEYAPRWCRGVEGVTV